MRQQCELTLDKTDFPQLGRREAGKVRDSYIDGERRYIIATDRVSCFDRIVGTMPYKGQILNQLAAFWFERTRDIDLDPDVVEMFDLLSEAYEEAAIYGKVPVRQALAKAASEARSILNAR